MAKVLNEARGSNREGFLSGSLKLLLLNTFFYGTAKVSRLAGYALVALWYPIGIKTDLFFLYYTVSLFFVTRLSVVLGEILVSSVPGRVSYPIYVMTFSISFFLLFPLNDSLLGLFVVYIIVGSASALLSGVVTVPGKTYRAPLASILGLALTLFWAYTGRDTSFGLEPIVWALTIGEIGKGMVLLGFVSKKKGEKLSFPWGEVLRHLLLVSIFGIPPIVARFDATYFEVGSVTLLSYASGISGLVITGLTSGILVTGGLGEFSDALHFLKRPLLLVVGLTMGLIGGAFLLPNSLILLTIILLLGVPASYIAVSAYGELRKEAFIGLFLGACVYVLIYLGLSWELMSILGIVGIAWALTLSEVFAAVVLSGLVWKKERSVLV